MVRDQFQLLTNCSTIDTYDRLVHIVLLEKKLLQRKEIITQTNTAVTHELDPVYNYVTYIDVLQNSIPSDLYLLKLQL